MFVPTNKGEQEIARYLDREEILPTGAMPYSQAAWYFFPYKKTKHYPSMYFPLEEEDFYLSYGESVHDILYNSRVFGMMLHLNKELVFDGLNRSDEVEPYRVYGTDIVFENRNGDWDITAGYKTLVQLLDTLYATSQMAHNKHIQVCQHVTCRKVFLAEAKGSKYCSKACAENALKWRYRQKKKREGEMNMSKKRGNNDGSDRQRKDGTWDVRFIVGRKADGKLDRRSVYASTQKEVLSKMKQAQAEILKDEYIAPSAITVAQWLDSWYQTYLKPNVRPSTASTTYSAVRNHLKPALGSLNYSSCVLSIFKPLSLINKRMG